MIKVEKTANTIDEGIKNLMSGAKEDYVRMSTSGGRELTGYSKEQVDNWDKKTRVMPGKKYIKIVQDTGVFCFIAKEDFKHFKNCLLYTSPSPRDDGVSRMPSSA